MEEPPKMGGGDGGGVFSQVNYDVLQSILKKLPALSYASAACVNKSWNKACSQILSRPRLASALSLNPSLHVAVKEVLDKVLSEPIRPQFAIACIGVKFSLEMTQRLLSERLGSKIPIVTNAASGIIGLDVLTSKVQEVKWEIYDDDDDDFLAHELANLDRGIVLVVGYLPGLKVNAIPLLRQKKEPQVPLVSKFMMDIKEYTNSVPGCSSPAGIIMFGAGHMDMKPILIMMDHAMSDETIIVGDTTADFVFRSENDSQNYNRDLFFVDAVALVFSRSRDRANDIGETQFHVALSVGVIPFGPRLNTVSVMAKGSECSWLTARMEGHNEILEGKTLLHDILNVMDHEESPDLYIGVTQNRTSSARSEQRAITTFHEVLRGDGDYFVVNGVGIKPGDSFLFYHSDTETASSSCDNAFLNLATLKANKREIFGGFMFSCYCRGDSFFGRENVDTAPFVYNFPGVPLGGVFCGGEIVRGPSSSIMQDEEQSSTCCMHVYSTVYLVMSYVPPTSEE